MSYPGDPAGGQQQPAYPYSDGGGGYPPPSPPGGGFGAPPPPSGGGFGAPPPPSGGGFGAPPPPPPGGGFGAPQSGPPAPSYGSDPNAPYGGGYGYDPNNPSVSGPPVSGMSFQSPTMSPVSGPTAPLSGPPGPLGGSPTPRRSPAMAIFASLAVLFLLATAILTVLFITKNGDYNDQRRTATQRQENINNLNSEIEKLKADVRRVEGERDAARRDLGGAQGQADELKRQKQVISNCLNLLAEAVQAERAGNAALAQQKSAAADPVCEEAGRYLD